MINFVLFVVVQLGKQRNRNSPDVGQPLKQQTLRQLFFSIWLKHLCQQ